MSTQPQTTQPQQQRRTEGERERRRRRSDLSDGRLRNLSIQGNIDPAYTYRFINDEPGRVHKLTVADDWEIVKASDLDPNAKDKAVGSAVERIVDRRSGQRAILVRKKREWYDADKAEEQASVTSTEQSLMQGARPGVDADAQKSGYVPRGGIALQNGAASSTYKP